MPSSISNYHPLTDAAEPFRQDSFPAGAGTLHMCPLAWAIHCPPADVTGLPPAYQEAFKQHLNRHIPGAGYHYAAEYLGDDKTGRHVYTRNYPDAESGPHALSFTLEADNLTVAKIGLYSPDVDNQWVFAQARETISSPTDLPRQPPPGAQGTLQPPPGAQDTLQFPRSAAPTPPQNRLPRPAVPLSPSPDIETYDLKRTRGWLQNRQKLIEEVYPSLGRPDSISEVPMHALRDVAQALCRVPGHLLSGAVDNFVAMAAEREWMGYDGLVPSVPGVPGDQEWLEKGSAALSARGKINEDGKRTDLTEGILSKARAAARRMHIAWRYRKSVLNPGQHPDLERLRVDDYAMTTDDKRYLGLFVDAYLEHQRAQQLE